MSFHDDLGADYETSSEAWRSGYLAALFDLGLWWEDFRPWWLPERVWVRVHRMLERELTRRSLV